MRSTTAFLYKKSLWVRLVTLVNIPPPVEFVLFFYDALRHLSSLDFTQTHVVIGQRFIVAYMLY